MVENLVSYTDFIFFFFSVVSLRPHISNKAEIEGELVFYTTAESSL